jgi:hypothetical protein
MRFTNILDATKLPDKTLPVNPRPHRHINIRIPSSAGNSLTPSIMASYSIPTYIRSHLTGIHLRSRPDPSKSSVHLRRPNFQSLIGTNHGPPGYSILSLPCAFPHFVFRAASLQFHKKTLKTELFEPIVRNFPRQKPILATQGCKCRKSSTGSCW